MDQPDVKVRIAQIALGIVVQILAISCWFATAAAVPSLSAAFDLDDAGRILLIVAVQLGFAAGAVAAGLARLSDRFRARMLLSIGSLATAAATVLPIAAAESAWVLVASRFLVGLLLACVYPTGMRAIVSWASSPGRGAAVAGMVAALTVGTAAPQLLLNSPIGDWRLVLMSCAGAAVIAATLGLFIREGPFVQPVAVPSNTGNPLAAAGQRATTVAYLGHMWEVYGFWVWLPTLLTALPATNANPGWSGFAIMGLAGATACVIGGVLARRYGNRRVARSTVVISAIAAVSTPLLPVVPAAVVIVMLSLWAGAAIADSPLYSAITGDQADHGSVGGAISLQMGLGYVISVGAIYAVPALAGIVGWQWAFAVLALGPIVAFVALSPRWQRPPGGVRIPIPAATGEPARGAPSGPTFAVLPIRGSAQRRRGGLGNPGDARWR